MSSPTPGPGSTRSPFFTEQRYLRVLYVDHQSGLRDVARLWLHRLGHTMECVGDSIMALGKATSGPKFDLVIADHDLPIVNGLELIHRLRAKGYAGKVIVISSSLTAVEESTYHELKVDRIMFKPVAPAGLRNCVLELFPGSGRVG